MFFSINTLASFEYLHLPTLNLSAFFCSVGVNAYIYIITNNGYVMFHPRLKSEYIENGRTKTIPNSSR